MSEWTHLLDDNGNRIHVGDTLRSQWGYNVTVYKDGDGHYYGKLVCEPGHSCADMPYALNGGVGHLVVIAEPSGVAYIIRAAFEEGCSDGCAIKCKSCLAHDPNKPEGCEVWLRSKAKQAADAYEKGTT